MTSSNGFTAGRKNGSEEITAGPKTLRPRGYIDTYNPHAKTRELLAQAEAVLDEYREYWPLTCRQIFYRLVSAYGFDKTEAAYGRLCHHLANARRGRLITFDAIRDDGVTTYDMDHFDDRDDFLRHVRRLGRNYTRNKLADQEVHIEVWCEAAGMLPQLHDVGEPYSVRGLFLGRLRQPHGEEGPCRAYLRDGQAGRHPAPGGLRPERGVDLRQRRRGCRRLRGG